MLRLCLSNMAARAGVLLRRALCLGLVGALVALGPAGKTRAEWVSTADASAGAAAEQGGPARAELSALLARADLAAELERLGVSPEQAQARLASLSDAEVEALRSRLAELPAGEGFLEIVVTILLVTILILAITDLLGFTDVFSFINPLPRGSAKSYASATASRR
jgi:hypothetical protein